ncbi:MAG: ABC transporter ATP-binding protein/permease [Tagaea sp.]|nr:ABC transporter ATP-binding protein/permease [Tagaea sp.]
MGIAAALTLAAAACEAIGIGLVFYLVASLQNPEAFLERPAVATIRDALGIASPSGFLIVICAGFILLFVLKAAISVTAGWLKTGLQWAIHRDLTRALFESYLYGPLAFHTRNNSSALLQTVTTGVSITTQGGIVGVTELLGDAVLLIAIAIAIMLIQPAIGGGALAIGTAMLVAYWRFGQTYFTRWGRQAKEVGQVTVRATVEPLVGVRAVKALGAEAFFAERLNANLARYVETQRRFAFVQTLIRPALETGMVCVLMGALIWLFGVGGNSAEVLPTLALIGVAAYRVIPALARIAALLQSLRFAVPMIEAVCADLERARRMPATGRRTGGVRVRTSLRLKGETFAYEGAQKPALTNVDVEVRIGETIALVGRSGSGKSTLVDLLSGLMPPQSGALLVDENPIASAEAFDRDTFGYVQQDTFLIDDTIAANVTLGRRPEDIDRDRVRKALEDAACGSLVQSLPDGIDAPIGERGVRLSGGQRQRLGIARALYGDPDVLIFDEATASLDNITEDEIVAAIGRLKRRRAVVIVAHRLSTVRHADRVIFLRAGHVCDVGRYDELIARNPDFAALARTESGAESTIVSNGV